MHNAVYADLGLDWVYDFADLETAEQAEEFLSSGDWFALNITMPYKPLALNAANNASAAARLAGGANVLVHTASGIEADNTDGVGCVAYLLREGVDVHGKNVVICGTGPTSLSIMHAVLAAGAAQVNLLGRNAQKADSSIQEFCTQAQELGVLTSGELHGGAYGDSSDALRDADVIIDATPLGMKPGDPPPFDTSLLHPGQVVLDVVYGHGETELARAAKTAGARFLDGRGMLVAQAVETVRDINEFASLGLDLEAHDLFAIMAEAADFNF